MDWLAGMNNVLHHIETHLTEEIAYEGLCKIVGVSMYEFSRIFSFMAGMSVSEYIRRRRLSQAVYDLQRSDEKIIDIALKYQYESPTTFSRAFKELHGASPTDARKAGVELKIYPPLSFVLQIKGAHPLNFRIEERAAFQIIGMTGMLSTEDDTQPASLWNATFTDDVMPTSETLQLTDITPESFDNFTQVTDTKMHMRIGFSPTPGNEVEKPPTHLTAAIDYASTDGKVKATVGFALNELADMVGEKAYEFTHYGAPIPAATYAVFSFTEERNAANMAAAYARILTEWFAGSGYARAKALPHLERFDFQDQNAPWEIWMPVENKLVIPH